MTATKTFFDIPAHNFSFLEEKIAKLNKTAVKLGCEETQVYVMYTFVKNVARPQEDQKLVEFMHVNVEGVAPVLNGWTFVAKREPMEESTSVLVKSVAGASVPAEFHDDHSLKCDHCKTNHRRVATFIVEKEGQYVEVGRSCLKDFLGHMSPEQYANYAEALNMSSFNSLTDPDYEGGFGRMTPVFSTKYISEIAAAMIRHFGYTSNKTAFERESISTSSNVADYLFPQPQYNIRNVVSITQADESVAADAIAYIASYVDNSHNDFWTNLKKIAAAEYITTKNIAFLAAGVNTFIKSQQEAAAKVSILSGIKSEKFADEGSKIAVKANVIHAVVFENNNFYASRKLCATVKTEAGHLVKIFTTSWDTDFQKGDSVTIIGKVGQIAPETYQRSPFAGMLVTTMASRSKIVAN